MSYASLEKNVVFKCLDSKELPDDLEKTINKFDLEEDCALSQRLTVTPYSPKPHSSAEGRAHIHITPRLHFRFRFM
jgi:hypothetical protein